MALISERELDPADQEGQRERLVGMLDVVPARGKAVREPWGRDLGRLPPPMAAVGLHQQHRCQFTFCDRSGRLWTEYLLPSRFQARSRALRQAG